MRIGIDLGGTKIESIVIDARGDERLRRRVDTPTGDYAATIDAVVGGGMVVEGRALTGANAIGGEWGHNPLPWPTDAERPGPECYCGKRGCIETFLSGLGFARDFEATAGRALPTAEIVAAAATGDGDAEGALQRYEKRLSRALATVINILDPEVIVLGGGMSNLERLYERVPALWAEWVFSDVVTTRPTPARRFQRRQGRRLAVAGGC